MKIQAREPSDSPAAGAAQGSWTFLTNHGHVLLGVALDPEVRVAELARSVGISARAVLFILRDLEDAGYVDRERVGRRTRYTVHRHRNFRHPTTSAHRVDDLIAIFTDPRNSTTRDQGTS